MLFLGCGRYPTSMQSSIVDEGRKQVVARTVDDRARRRNAIIGVGLIDGMFLRHHISTWRSSSAHVAPLNRLRVIMRRELNFKLAVEPSVEETCSALVQAGKQW